MTTPRPTNTAAICRNLISIDHRSGISQKFKLGNEKFPSQHLDGHEAPREPVAATFAQISDDDEQEQKKLLKASKVSMQGPYSILLKLYRTELSVLYRASMLEVQTVRIEEYNSKNIKVVKLQADGRWLIFSTAAVADGSSAKMCLQ